MTPAAPQLRAISLSFCDLQDHTLGRDFDAPSWWDDLARQATWEVERMSLRPPREGFSASYATADGVEEVRFVSIQNAAVRPEGQASAHDGFVLNGDFSEKRQRETAESVVKAWVECCKTLKDGNNIVWRKRPEWARVLTPEGLSIRLYGRLAWINGA